MDRSAVPYVDDAMSRVDQEIGYDGFCLFAVDPVTGLRTSMFSRNGLTVPTARLLHNETVEHDVNRYVELVRAPRKAGVLALSKAFEPPSPRLHEILRPEGYTSELRVALVDRGRYLGALSMFRDDPRRPFQDADADVAASLIGQLCKVIRGYHVRREVDSRDTRPAGVVLFRDGQPFEASDDALYWLDELRSGGPAGVTADDAQRSLFEVARAAGGGAASPVCRIRTRSGRWLVVSGTRIGEDVAVVLQPASVRQVLPAFAGWCALTPREAQVVGLAAEGHAAKRIARRLNLSILTVNAHLGSAYRKAGVAGRDELVALLA